MPHFLIKKTKKLDNLGFLKKQIRITLIFFLLALYCFFSIYDQGALAQLARAVGSQSTGQGFESLMLHQYKFSACKSADDCKQFFCAFCTCFARIYRNLCRKQRISKLDFRQCVLNKKPRFSLFAPHSSPDDFKNHKALESKILQKHTPKYLKSLFLKIENIKVL